MECSFGPDRLQKLAQLERRHFWFVGRRLLIDRLIARHLDRSGRPVLDVGCGTGLMLRRLAGRGQRVVGLDLRPEGLAATRRALPGCWVVHAAAERLPLRDGRCGAALLLDVLEHVDDRAALAEVRRVLGSGGIALITVPALPWLWSFRDEAAGHLRRYTRPSLERVLTESGFRIRAIRYYQCLLFPLLLMARWLGRNGPAARDAEERPPQIVNAVLTWLNRLEVVLGDVIPWPWGSSLVAVCQRP